MSMALISQKLLEEELKKKPENPTDQQSFYYSMVEKELYLIMKLNIELSDMRGDEKEVADRLEQSAVLICTYEEYENIRKSIQFKDEIISMINNLFKEEF